MPFEEKIAVGGVPFVSTTYSDAVEVLAKGRGLFPGGLSVRLSNAYCVALAQDDDDYRALLKTSGANLPDGTPVWVVMMLKAFISRLRRPSRVRGPSLFESVLMESQNQQVTHFFLGGSQETLAALLSKVEIEYPELQVVGAYSPAFGPLCADYVRDCHIQVARVRPDIVWIGLGSPKQDFLSTELAVSTGAVCIGVGAAFDFFAGSVRQAPRFFRLSGTEWLFRLAMEPRRLWRRYFFGNTKFIVTIAKDLFSLWSRKKDSIRAK
ncbi:WecB/TagA/CpsF family glycosyltransferase [Kocuria rosea]|uniref:WecB/TagA/CpsF family glycosyltransferase n=1 Tax=Kocuria rosea TaxID=1275 RepID=UPI002540179B|nr:WecB/TagA/CpsF family glycosyltransferase [Kocuria rosea]WIG16364.1 WecB/TagA/CpsF family glycosyltransferase [Kocuria rosea]